jgi:hypothetical protein
MLTKTGIGLLKCLDDATMRIMGKLNLLLDFACDLGYTSRLVKFFKDKGITIRQLSYDLARLRLTYVLGVEKTDALLNNVSEILALVDNTRDLWKTCCIEVWVEENSSMRIKETALRKVNELCVYIRHGRRNRLIRKIAWIDQCHETAGITIPESVTRKCIDNSSSVDTIKARIIEFTMKMQGKQ